MVRLRLDVTGSELFGYNGAKLNFFAEEIFKKYGSRPTVLQLGGNDLCCHPSKTASNASVNKVLEYFTNVKKAYSDNKQLFVCSILMRGT